MSGLVPDGSSRTRAGAGATGAIGKVDRNHLFLPYVVARGGATSVEEAWRRMHSGFTRGARTASDLSLARASERIGSSGIYVRVYWAGAALMLAADLQLRAQSGGRQSLGTALEQLSRCCARQPSRRTERLLGEIFDFVFS